MSKQEFWPTGATILANALGRDITEHLERMRK